MKKLFISLGLCVCCSFLIAQNTNPIQDAMVNYDYETALSLINQEEPTIPLLYQKGRALKGLGNNLEALEVFRKIVVQDSLNPRAYIEVAECYKSLAKQNQALDYYQKALILNPDNKYTRIQYINLLLNLQKYQEALGESSLLTEKDSSAIALHLQAQSFEGTNQPLPAAGCYSIIQEKYPDDFLSAAKLGSLFIGGKYYDEAIETTEKYRKIDSTNIAVNRQNALAYCLKKDYSTAIQRYEYLVNQGDSSFHTCYYLGISYYAKENYYGAHDMLEIARKYDPQNVNLLYYLGRSCAKTSWKEQGVAYLQDAIELSVPKDSSMIRLYIGMTDCYKMAFMFKEQIQSIKERYEKYDRNNHKLLYDLAFVYYYSLKDTPNAIRSLEAFLKTRSLQNKEQEPETDDAGNVILGTTNYYNAAEAWLKDIREHKKTEDFFKGKVPEKKNNLKATNR
ncbi:MULTISPECIES: tetratricopeptide repeat protein [Bacteroides]|jgi:tetratricopeptide (TPR) repeat protein|uniref:tetratricopeptide repeat protein n=1 Tax=Bacteroides TaxID=816 RepID=UPI000E431341|nr:MULTISPECIES: tetratricopeptide repeat protein [Bacteroides]RGM49173.1 hypothetical protein DXC10_06225 [Bacteroides sp. OM08-11]